MLRLIPHMDLTNTGKDNSEVPPVISSPEHGYYKVVLRHRKEYFRRPALQALYRHWANRIRPHFSKVDGTDSSSLTEVDTAAKAITALATLTTAINTKDAYRAKLGYLMNRLESAVTILDIQAENLLAAESRISDVDVATETAALTRNQVLAQAGISMLAQANTMPQMALQLLT